MVRWEDPYNDSKLGTSERYFSYYASGLYTYLGRYVLSGTIRRDESNLFGVNENQKGVPLGSLGLSWQISKEEFYEHSNTAKWLPFLKLRVTDGYNGKCGPVGFGLHNGQCKPDGK